MKPKSALYRRPTAKAAKPATTANDMVKLLLIILIGLALFAWGFTKFGSGDKSSSSGQTPTVSNPADALDSAKDAVDQSQNLQDKINQKAADQLSQ